MQNIVEAMNDLTTNGDYTIIPIYTKDSRISSIFVVDNQTEKVIYHFDFHRSLRTDYDEDISVDDVLTFDRFTKDYFFDWDRVTIYQRINSRLMVAVHLS